MVSGTIFQIILSRQLINYWYRRHPVKYLQYLHTVIHTADMVGAKQALYTTKRDTHDNRANTVRD